MQKGNKIAHKKKHTAKKKQQKTDLRATDTAKKGTKWNSNNDQTEPYVKKSIGKQASKWSRKRTRNSMVKCLSKETTNNNNGSRWKSQQRTQQRHQQLNDAMHHCFSSLAGSRRFVCWLLNSRHGNRFERKQRSEKCVFKFIHTLHEINVRASFASWIERYSAFMSASALSSSSDL